MTMDALQRERDYHNERFADETRLAQAKYYFALKHCAGHYDAEVTERIRGAVALEYGCATGDAAMKMAHLAQFIHGIDISDVAIDKAAARAQELAITNVEFKTGDAHETGYPDAMFDLVYGSGIIHHLDTRRSLEEIRRILKPGGVAIFKEPLGENIVFNLYRRLTPSARTPDEHPLLRADLDIARELFTSVDIEYFGLSTLLAVPFHKSKSVSSAIFDVTASVDEMLFRTPLRSQAWHILAILTR